MRDKTDHAIRFNVMADLMAAINKINPVTIPFRELQNGDQGPIGPVTELTVRTLGRFFHLVRQSQAGQETLKLEQDGVIRRDLIHAIDSWELDAELVLNYYLKQLKAEPGLAGWHEAPIFTIRKAMGPEQVASPWCAVVRKQDHDHYQRHLLHRPYKAGNTYSLYRAIALDSIK